MKNGPLTQNVAQLVDGLPLGRNADDLPKRLNTDVARRLLAAAKVAGPRPAPFYTLALGSGARRRTLRPEVDGRRHDETESMS